MAVNSESGLLQWVVDGTLVEDSIDVPHVRDTKNKPTNLTGKIVLGAWQNGKRKWFTMSNKVTSINIFSTSLTIEEMQQHTMHNGLSMEFKEVKNYKK